MPDLGQEIAVLVSKFRRVSELCSFTTLMDLKSFGSLSLLSATLQALVLINTYGMNWSDRPVSKWVNGEH